MCTTAGKKPGPVQALGGPLGIIQSRFPAWARDPLTGPGPGTEARVRAVTVQAEHRRAQSSWPGVGRGDEERWHLAG